jgi:hypothetical protein
VNDNPELPQSIGLTAYPNPFNANTVLSFTLPRAAQTRLAVYDLLGREQLVLLAGQLAAGEHRALIHGFSLPSGTYFARLQTGSSTTVQRLLLLK